MTDFVLSPQVIKEATSYVPFRNVTLDTDTLDFEEDVTFEGAALKPLGEQTIVEVTMRVGERSNNGNEGVKFRTDLWLNNAICAGSVRPKDADPRDWQGTQKALRTLNSLAKVLGIATDNPVVALTAIDAPQGSVHVKMRVYRKNTGEHRWDISKVTKVTL